MAIKRMTKEGLRNSGVLNPVGHIILAFPEAVTGDAVAALHSAGFSAEDILVYGAEEAAQRLRSRIESAGQGAGFGYEITQMRRFLGFAEEGCGWLVVYAPQDAQADRVVEVAERFGARCAVRYHRLANEDLV